MQENIVFLTICAFLAVVFVVAVALSVRGNSSARYFLWTWAAALLVGQLFAARYSGRISSLVAAIMVGFFIYITYLINKRGLERLEVSHEETRRVLAESNNRIDEERRTISRRLHDDVNPTLLLAKTELMRLQNALKDREDVREALAQVAKLLTDAYNDTRDIIKNTRIEVIDSIGFTAAVESLVNHYTDFFDKPKIELTHNLPKRPAFTQTVAVNAYRIIQEALFNAIKHSGAKTVTLTIRMRGTDSYEVVIEDNGVGIKAKSPSEAAGIGLIDMRERARVLGTTLKVQSAGATEKRPGTRISFVFSAEYQ